MSNGNQCLQCCGLVLYWLPRILVPLSIIWGLISHIVYASDLSNAFFRYLFVITGSVSGFLAFLAYYQTCRIGPGSPKDFPELIFTDPETSVGLAGSYVPECMQNSVEAKQDGGARFCSKCQCYKPDRTHHCRQCGICILRMDHHCPWFSTCIGFHNHKFFVQFLWYVWILCMSADLVALPVLINFFKEDLYTSQFIGVNFVMYMMLGTVFNLVLICFGGYTTWLVAGNRTTLESMEPSAYRTSLPASQWRYRHPPSRDSLGNMYDVGTSANLRQVFGSTWIEWLLPIRARLPLDGTAFPVNEELRLKAEERAQTEISMHQRKRQWDLNQQQQHI